MRNFKNHWFKLFVVMLAASAVMSGCASNSKSEIKPEVEVNNNELSENEVTCTNEFFPHQDGDIIGYTGEFMFDDIADFDGEVKVEKMGETDDGILYCLNILEPGIELIDNFSYNTDCSKIYLNVTKDEIYLYDYDENGNGFKTLIMSAETTEHPTAYEFYNDGTTSVYREANTDVETGFYQRFVFEKGIGLVEYRRGYGAGRNHIELKIIKQQPNILKSTANFKLEAQDEKYHYEVYDNNKNVIYSSTNEIYPEFIKLEENLYELTYESGISRKSIYFNTETGYKSEMFNNSVYLTNGIISYVTVFSKIENGTYKLHFIDFLDLYNNKPITGHSADYLNKSTSHTIEYAGGDEVTVTYYTDGGETENKVTLKVPELASFTSSEND